MTDNDLVINLNLLFIELEVNGNYLGSLYYSMPSDGAMVLIDREIDYELENMRIWHDYPEWLMQ